MRTCPSKTPLTRLTGHPSLDRQYRLLNMILEYDALCRDAITKGAPLSELMAIDSREKIGRAKSIPDDQYQEAYAAIEASMTAEIEKIIAKAGAEDYD